jgi:hypothetical protein
VAASGLNMFCLSNSNVKVGCHRLDVTDIGDLSGVKSTLEIKSPPLSRRAREGWGTHGTLPGMGILFGRNARKADGERRLWFVLVRPEPAAAGEDAVADQGPDREPSVGVTDFLAFYR